MAPKTNQTTELKRFICVNKCFTGGKLYNEGDSRIESADFTHEHFALEGTQMQGPTERLPRQGISVTPYDPAQARDNMVAGASAVTQLQADNAELKEQNSSMAARLQQLEQENAQLKNSNQQ